eukprot:CAMPEP_0179053020 /NCGR_PEP_ID=MMETSP0796-20121207/22054_1 /TAXON_ID=73915 /ORGANISM="Pyrodinium bahamense, Strain pbaha01" /LENGTH=495 /DNA_ID=CAMNT_0020749597 /DNA_START=39 /DNA_END=1526 /DNA_ORIENTATION=+
MNLRNGFLSGPKRYHPALRTMILMNEPDLKLQSGFLQGVPGPPEHFCKALVSALDAVLDAEREAGVEGPLPNLTVAFSFARCPKCSRFGDHPSLGQMWDLRRAMKHPELVGYLPRNNLWAIYRARFVNSFNTANSALDMRHQFLDMYDEHFQGTPVFIGEYHSPYFFDQQLDLEEILEISANRSTMLQGICFFEFQVRYDKGGAEMNFGMFGLRFSRILANVDIAKQTFSSWCLKPMRARSTAKCGLIEADTDFVVRATWSVNISHIPSAEMCCARCHEHNHCQSWTWEKYAGLRGFPSNCMLKGGAPVHKVRKDGCMSGWPASQRTLLQAPPGKLQDNVWVHSAVQRAFGGPGVDPRQLCPPGAPPGLLPRHGPSSAPTAAAPAAAQATAGPTLPHATVAVAATAAVPNAALTTPPEPPMGPAARPAAPTKAPAPAATATAAARSAPRPRAQPAGLPAARATLTRSSPHGAQPLLPPPPPAMSNADDSELFYRQ